MTPDEKQAVQRGVAGQALRAAAGSAPPGPRSTAARACRTMEGVVLAEEFARAKAPLRADFFGDTLVGPTILQWGTEEQKKEFLPQDHEGRDALVPGLLASPTPAPTWPRSRPRAVLDGDEWVINGQKVWTTQAQFADYCFLLARTDPDAAKHAGISYLLVPMKQPGVEVRADHPARRHRRVQRGVLRRRPLPEGQRRRRRQQRLEGRQHHARLRARACRPPPATAASRQEYDA